MTQTSVPPVKSRSLVLNMLFWLAAGIGWLFRNAYKRWLTAVPFTIFLLLFAGWFSFKTPFYWWWTIDTVEFTVTSAESAIARDGSGERRLTVYTRDLYEDGQTRNVGEGFVNEDLFWVGKYGSSNLQGIFVPEHRFRAKVTGLRFSNMFLHTYRVIISAEDITGK